MRELDFIREIILDTSAFLLHEFGDRSVLSIQTKQGVADLVTQADTLAQQRIESAILQAFPGDCLFGEESGKDTPPADLNARCWVCDPIDGTHNFARGMVQGWGISLAFVEGSEPRAAGVGMPGLGELFLAAEGQGATRNGKPIRVSTITDLAASRIEVDFARPSDRLQTLEAGMFVLKAAGQVRCHGASVVGLCTVACGSAEAYVHGGLQPWDFAAAMHIIREAGGRVTRLDGVEANVFDGRLGMLASNGVIHQTILDGIEEESIPC